VQPKSSTKKGKKKYFKSYFFKLTIYKDSNLFNIIVIYQLSIVTV
jgi:hypothetical protein